MSRNTGHHSLIDVSNAHDCTRGWMYASDGQWCGKRGKDLVNGCCIHWFVFFWIGGVGSHSRNTHSLTLSITLSLPLPLPLSPYRGPRSASTACDGRGSSMRSSRWCLWRTSSLNSSQTSTIPYVCIINPLRESLPFLQPVDLIYMESARSGLNKNSIG